LSPLYQSATRCTLDGKETKMTRIPARSLILGLLLTTTALASAQAADRSQGAARKGAAPSHVQRPHGDYTRHTERQRTENGHTRTDTWTSDRGTATRSAEVVNDRATQTRTRSVDSTGPKGGMQSRDVVSTRDPATGTWTKDVTVDRTPPPAGDGG
jgi:hypothetical protein